MKIYFLRHGQADWPEWDRPDDERPLTKKGKKEMRKVADTFEAIKVDPAVILTSPLPRAAETAQIVADTLGKHATEEPALGPGFDSQKLSGLVGQYSGQDVLLVGHEPDFSRVIAVLTGARIVLAKAGLARVDLADPNSLQGELVWLIPPKILKN